jgi:hypothetical protein
MATEKQLINGYVAEKSIRDAEKIIRSEMTCDYDTGWADALSSVADMIKRIPTVDAVEVVHGRWEDVKETEMYVPDKKYTVTHTAETCSNCKVRIGFIGGKQYLYDNQCPNCGAKMDGGNEDV